MDLDRLVEDDLDGTHFWRVTGTDVRDGGSDDIPKTSELVRDWLS